MLRSSGAANLPSPPTPTSQSVFPAAKKSGATSVLQSVRFIGSNMEVQILTCSLEYIKIGFMEHILNFCCFFNSLRNRRPLSLP